MSRPKLAWCANQSPMYSRSGGVTSSSAKHRKMNPSHVSQRTAREPERLEAEVLEVLGVLGPHELAVEVVDPGVVGALEADRRAAFRSSTAVPRWRHTLSNARMTSSLPRTRSKLLAQHVPQDEAPRSRDLLGPPDRDPVAEEDLLALPRRTRRRRGTPSRGAASPCGTGRGCRAMARAGDGGRRARGVGWTMAKNGSSFDPSDRSRRT